MIKTLFKQSLPERITKQAGTSFRMFQAMVHDFNSDPPILIFSMPKSGTSTVWVTIRDVIPQKVYKLHKLSQDGIRLAIEKRKTHKNPKLVGIDSLSEIIRKKIDNNPEVCWQVITSTREPIAQAVSRLFQGIDNQQPQLIDENGQVKVDDAVQFLQQKFESFDERLNPELTWYDMVWFDRELKPVFDIDVYNHPFSHADGFSIIEGSRAKVLILRAEDLNKSLNVALTKFLGIPGPFEIKKANIAEEKRFRDAYHQVKKNLKIPRAVCENIYSSKYARHFYTESERNQFIEKWSS